MTNSWEDVSHSYCSSESQDGSNLFLEELLDGSRDEEARPVTDSTAVKTAKAMLLTENWSARRKDFYELCLNMTDSEISLLNRQLAAAFGLRKECPALIISRDRSDGSVSLSFYENRLYNFGPDIHVRYWRDNDLLKSSTKDRGGISKWEDDRGLYAILEELHKLKK